MNNIMLLLLILERPQRAECHLSLVNVTEHLSHKQQSLLSEFKRIHTRDDHALEIYYDVKI